MPNTSLGRWSIGLAVATPILFVIGASLSSSLYKFVPAGGSVLEDLAVRPALAFSAIAAMGCGIASFITGLLGIQKAKERSLLVYASTVFGALVIVFLLGELFSTH